MAEEIVPNSVGWYILEGFPWWPVYICDVTKLRPKLHLLGDGHRKILKKARDFPADFIVVYYFGSHDFSLVGLKKGVLRPWDCAQKDQFLKGHPRHLAKKKGVMEDLLEAIQEAEEYLSQPEDIRLPQHMVPSDLDPTLEPPPPELVPQEMAVDMEEDEDDAMEDEDAPENEDADDSDVEKKKKEMKRKEKEKKQEKKKKAKEKKEKEKKEKKEKKEREKKEKKARKVKNKDDAADAKKRKNDAEDAAASPSKVAKTSGEADVKSEAVAVKKEHEEKKPPPADITTEALSIILEKEIRWILVNCPFEEMTTKTVRKMLEDRLRMDLRHHKASIKEGVARVIASMEEDAGDSASTAPEESAPAPAPVEETPKPSLKVEAADAAAPVTPEEVVKKEVDTAAEEEAARADEVEKTKSQLETASKNLSLALDLEPKIVDVLNSLMPLASVDKDVLAASSLQPRLVKLRAHRSSNISEQVSVLVKKWDVEDLIPAPKPITKEEILELKEKLENSETSHDELLVCLGQLGEMALTISHLKKTGIARSVSKLRQHGNDKVSTKAHELRQKWIKQINDEKADGSDPLKTLKTLNRILEQHSDGADAHKLQNKQLAALDQLHSMTLDTKDIIDSKVGISVSKLRKSSNDKIAQLAKRLRKKWQAEAKANGA